MKKSNGIGLFLSEGKGLSKLGSIDFQPKIL